MQRRLQIDHLRNIALLLLVVFHTAMIFTTYPWIVKEYQNYRTADWGMALLAFWLMPLQFYLSGMSLYWSGTYRTAKQLVSERMMRLLLPLVVAIMTTIPIQVYVERTANDVPQRLSPINFDGSFFQFYPQFFDCCYPSGNLSYHHLWFMVYLFLYALVLMPLIKLASSERWRNRYRRLAEMITSGWGVMAPVFSLTFGEYLLRERFPQTLDVVNDWANHALFLQCALMGVLIASSDRVIEHLKDKWTIFAAGSVISTAIWFGAAWVVFKRPYCFGYDTAQPIFMTLFMFMAQYLGILAMSGFATRYLAKPLPLLTPFTSIAMPFYIFHQTVVVVLGYYALAWKGNATVKYLLLCLAAYFITSVLSSLAIRLPFVAFAFGGQRHFGLRNAVTAGSQRQELQH